MLLMLISEGFFLQLNQILKFSYSLFCLLPALKYKRLSNRVAYNEQLFMQYGYSVLRQMGTSAEQRYEDENIH